MRRSYHAVRRRPDHSRPPRVAPNRWRGEVSLAERRKSGDRRAAGGHRGTNRRPAQRVKRRVPCEVRIEGDWVRAFVLDVSQSGLFVQTGKSVDPGTELELRLRLPGVAHPVELRTRVARSRRVPPQLARVVVAGVGLRIVSAPGEFYEFVAGLSGGAARPRTAPQPSAPVAEKPLDKYRVRAKQTSGTRSRTLTIEAEDDEDAELRARRRLGLNWTILAVEKA